MKLNKFVGLLVIGLVLTIAASGCRKKPVNTTLLPGSRAGRVADDSMGGLKDGDRLDLGANAFGKTGEGIAFGAAGEHQGWLEDAQTLKTETVYFDFDSSAIRSSERPKVSAVADYLKANAAKAVRVEGNCDERGTEEYNRALGERRALAVREELVRLGIAPTRVDTISYGKDKPLDPGHNESAWRVNRRDDFIVLTAPGQ
ncbi:MAG TPA: OmpA family protein [Verrucomicrobiota bacterium]|jgi:peptidoglycan-associated lipoprotein|nr:OmpA family protein [Verrucomicrobiota bacterium]HQL79012.1 OmpA family protein [Verrucomicrobiota bacterium]